MGKNRPNKNEGHRKRLREKFLESGLSGFHEYEIIELLLSIGTPRKDCKQEAKEALKRFKSLPGVMEASKEELFTVKGIGPKNIIGIRLVKAVADRYLEKKLQGKDPIHNSKDLFKYLYHRFRDNDRECFTAVFLDAKNKVISSDILFQGLSSSIHYC